MPDAGATGPLGAVDTRLPDRIYEAPFAPDLWPAILDDLALIAEARGGELFVINGHILNWTASDTMRASMERFIAGNWLQRGERLARLTRARHAGFLTEPDIFSEPKRQADPVYRHLLIPVGLGCGHGHHAADRQRGLPLPGTPRAPRSS